MKRTFQATAATAAAMLAACTAVSYTSSVGDDLSVKVHGKATAPLPDDVRAAADRALASAFGAAGSPGLEGLTPEEAAKARGFVAGRGRASDAVLDSYGFGVADGRRAVAVQYRVPVGDDVDTVRIVLATEPSCCEVAGLHVERDSLVVRRELEPDKGESE